MRLPPGSKTYRKAALGNAVLAGTGFDGNVVFGQDVGNIAEMMGIAEPKPS
jgi:hypothetical protein